jgi:hypothetical protein
MQAAVGIKAWITRTPCVDEIRPVQCAGCGAASRPVGSRSVVHGHGLLERQVRGVLAVGEQPGGFALWVRRYACQLCLAIMTVALSFLSQPSQRRPNWLLCWPRQPRQAVYPRCYECSSGQESGVLDV